MRTRGAHARTRALAAAAAALGFACLRDFPTGAPLRFTVQPSAAWPDTLTVTDVETLRVDVRDPGGLSVAGIEVDWRSGDVAVLAVAPLAAPPPWRFMAGTRPEYRHRIVEQRLTQHGTGA